MPGQRGTTVAQVEQIVEPLLAEDIHPQAMVGDGSGRGLWQEQPVQDLVVAAVRDLGLAGVVVNPQEGAGLGFLAFWQLVSQAKESRIGRLAQHIEHQRRMLGDVRVIPTQFQ